MTVKEKHGHYFKNVAHLKDIDTYRVLERFGITDPSLQHAIKKLLVAGGRGGGKSLDQDVQESIDSLLRFQEMRLEDQLEAQSGVQDMAVRQVVNIVQNPRRVMPQKLRKELAARRKPAKRVNRRGRA